MKPRPVKWEGVAVSIVGHGHLQRCLPCQDSSALDIRGAVASLIVADGCGSHAHAEDASREAVRACREALDPLLSSTKRISQKKWVSILKDCFYTARRALEVKAGKPEELREWGTTLLILILTERFAVSASIGDCAAVVKLNDGEFELISPPECGEFINESFFLSDPDWEDFLRTNALTGFSEYAVAFSDGLQFIALSRGAPFTPFISGLVHQLMQISAGQRDFALRQYFEKHIGGIRTSDDISFVATWGS